jgi:hypothetical protein
MAQVPPLTWNDRPDGAGPQHADRDGCPPHRQRRWRPRRGYALARPPPAAAAPAQPGPPGLIHVAARPARTGTTRPGPSGATPLEEYRPGWIGPHVLGDEHLVQQHVWVSALVIERHQNLQVDSPIASPHPLQVARPQPSELVATSAQAACFFLVQCDPSVKPAPRLPMPHEYVGHCGAGGTLCTLRTPFSRVERRISVVVRLRRSLIVDGPISSGAHFTSSRIVPPTWSSNSIIAALVLGIGLRPTPPPSRARGRSNPSQRKPGHLVRCPAGPIGPNRTASLAGSRHEQVSGSGTREAPTPPERNQEAYRRVARTIAFAALRGAAAAAGSAVVSGLLWWIQHR